MNQFPERVSSLSGLSIIGGSLENHVSTGTVGLGLGVPPNGNEHKVGVSSSVVVSIAYTFLACVGSTWTFS
jgi:hypothetical protein